MSVVKMLKAWDKASLMKEFGTLSVVVAYYGGHYSIIEELVKSGADIHVPDISGNSRLVIIHLEKQHLSLVKVLVEVGAGVSLQG